MPSPHEKRRSRAEYARLWRSNNPERERARRERLRETRRSQGQECRERMLKTIHGFFGNVCQYCGFSDQRALQLDHISGNGSSDRMTIYQKYHLIQERPVDARTKFQLLCANCNWIKRVVNHEYKTGVANA